MSKRKGILKTNKPKSKDREQKSVDELEDVGRPYWYGELASNKELPYTPSSPWESIGEVFAPAADPEAPARYTVYIADSNAGTTMRQLMNRRSTFPLKSGEYLFGENYIKDPTFSGVLIKKRSNPLAPWKYFVLTCGHAFPEGYLPDNYSFILNHQDWAAYPHSKLLEVEGLVEAKYGGYGIPDYALVRVNPDNLSPDDAFDASTVNNTEPNGTISAFSHPWGFRMMKQDYQGSLLSLWNQGQSYKNRMDRLYFHLFLDAAPGSSGAPVWFKADGNWVLAGIISAAGNIISSILEDDIGEYVWNNSANGNFYNGTQVLKFNEIQKHSDEWSANPQSLTLINSTSLDDNDRYIIKREKICWKQNGQIRQDIAFNSANNGYSEKIVFADQAGNQVLIQDDNLENYQDSASPMIINELYWPFDWLERGLELVIELKSQLSSASPLPKDSTVAVLGGIGSLDILDELPLPFFMGLDQVWAINGSPIGLTPDFRRQAIRIRYFEGITDVFRRQL